jgi:hypothetical protein
VSWGFLPAAAQIGLETIVLTDQPEAHHQAYAAARGGTGPWAADPAQVVGCDVRDPRELMPQKPKREYI